MVFSRRDFLKGSALLSIGTTNSSLLKGALAFGQQHPASTNFAQQGKILILVQLAGGNDGIQTVVPGGDPAYRTARPKLAIPQEQLLPLGEGFGFAPGMTGLKSLWDKGKLAVVRGVGYPEQSYSHFKSMAIWESGDPELALSNGWLGRTLDAMESEMHDPFFGFKAGAGVPPELRGEHIPIPAVANVPDYGFKTRGQPASASDARVATLMKLYEEYPSNSRYGVLLETTADTAVSSSAALAKVHAAYTAKAEYPETPFASALQLLAEAITGGLGIRVGHCTLGGFDTHSNQVADHPALLATLDAGLSAFYADLEAHGRADDVLVLTWSEFGRRVQENANESTDHGSASVLFALGNGVRGGFYGDQPSLSKLIDNGNLSFTTDFRRVYATVIEDWLGVPSAPLLGREWDKLGFLAA
ncbi:MAG: DUF1501 domain-containing protein [Dehalococcoidia bacterium]